MAGAPAAAKTNQRRRRQDHDLLAAAGPAKTKQHGRARERNLPGRQLGHGKQIDAAGHRTAICWKQLALGKQTNTAGNRTATPGGNWTTGN